MDFQVEIENFDRIPLLSKDWPGMLLLKLYKISESPEGKQHFSADSIQVHMKMYISYMRNEY